MIQKRLWKTNKNKSKIRYLWGTEMEEQIPNIFTIRRNENKIGINYYAI